MDAVRSVEQVLVVAVSAPDTDGVVLVATQGVPTEIVAERVAATVKTIANQYDWASKEDRWRQYRNRMEQQENYVDQLTRNGDSENGFN